MNDPAPATSQGVRSADSTGSATRLESIDLLRGLVMVLMALDHTRDFFHNGVYQGFDPLDLSKTTIPLFFTRWITHYCAPVFVFLAGTGAFLSTTRGKTTRELSWFLLTRGLWLVVLELTWVRWAGWSFAIDLHEHWGNVIWAIGWSMVSLAGLVHLPVKAIVLIGATIIVGHNALDPLIPEDFGPLSGLWRILHEGGSFNIATGLKLGAGYPLLPWVGVMAAGYGFGAIMLRAPAWRQSWLMRGGWLMVAAFLLLRVINVYGDAKPWSSQSSGFLTFLSMLDCTKYPPSLCYLLMTLGPAAILLARLDRLKTPLLNPFLVFGRVPLFYYLLHLPLIHGFAVAVNLIRFGHANWLNGTTPAKPPGDAGFELPVVYLVWLIVVILLYPACHWFAASKRRRKDAWLSYL
jgi:uncharacterized membrane protein